MSDAPTSPRAAEGRPPDVPPGMAYEQGHRYAFAMELARGRRVLDAACGDGDGAALLARTAASVWGLDVAPEAVARARARHAHPRLRFDIGDPTRLDGVAEGSIDLVISFESLERFADQDAVLAAFARVLAPDGLLIVSTPDRRTHTDLAGLENPHHVRELYREEFEALLSRHFARYRLYGQRIVSQSLLWRLDGGHGATASFTQDGGDVFPGVRTLPMHHVAVCAKRGEALGGLPALSCFADAHQSVFQHYQQVVRDLAAAEHDAHRLRQRLRDAGLPDHP